MSEARGQSALPRHTFPALDTLRAIGAVAVLTTHAAFWAGVYTAHGVLGTLLARMDVGVAIFFVLSGFLLTRPYLLEAATGAGPPSVGRYFWKRILRIAPVYWVTIAVTIMFVSQSEHRGAVAWLMTFGLLDTYTSTELPDGLTQMWSLAVEVAFYLLLPVLMWLAGAWTRQLRPWRIAWLIGAMWGITIWWHFGGDAIVDPARASPGQWLPAYLSWFGIGITLALVHTLLVLERGGAFARLCLDLARSPGVCWTIAAGLLLVAATPLAGPSMLAAPTSGETLVKNVLYAGIGGLVVLPGVFPASGSMLHRWLTSRVGRHLGIVSYGVFCMHLPMLHLVMWQTGWPLFEGHLLGIWALAFLYSVIAAEALYRFVELPTARLRNLGIRKGRITAVRTGSNARY